jgi:cytochrome c oxidase subunit II
MKLQRNATLALVLVGVLPILLAVGCASTPKKLTPAQIETLQPSGQLTDGVRVVKVEAKRYEFIPDPIVVRAGEKVRLTLTSLDVTHGFALPAYKINQRVEPHKISTVEFTAGKQGAYPIHCSVFCGWGHPFMKATLVVLPAAK